jgi:cation diffusion facilitator family transporter
MGFESVSRLIDPTEIHFSQAIPVAVLGLVVNIISAWMLSTGTSGHDHHEHQHEHGHSHAHHHDLNLRSAYLHVLADAATSVLAIIALLGGLYFGAGWLDPVMGLVGTVLVGRWALGLLRDTGRVLLDAEMDAPVVREVHEVIEALPQSASIRDLHVWRVGKGKFACIVSVATDAAVTAGEIRSRLAVHEELVHITVEIVTADRSTQPSPRAP